MRTNTETTPTNSPSASETVATASPATVAEKRSGSTGPAATKIAKQIDGLVFDCERLSVYHAARRNWFEQLHRWTLFLIVFSGTSAFAVNVSMSAAPYLALLPAALGLVDLTFNLSGRAREHGALYQRFCWLRGTLLMDIESPEVLVKAQQDIHAIYADEPPTYHALDAWSHNLACAGRGADRQYLLSVPRWHSVLKNIWPFQGVDYRLVG